MFSIGGIFGSLWQPFDAINYNHLWKPGADAHPPGGRSRFRSSRPATFFHGDWS